MSFFYKSFVMGITIEMYFVFKPKHFSEIIRCIIKCSIAKKFFLPKSNESTLFSSFGINCFNEIINFRHSLIASKQT